MENVSGRIAVLAPPAGPIVLLGMDVDRDRLAYEEVIAPLEGRMMRAIWRIVRNSEEAEDTMQDALAVIWKRLDRICRHPNPQALILKICTNAAVDALRRQRRSRQFADPEILDRLPSPSSSDEWEMRESEAKIREAIGCLPKKQAVAVLMRILEGQSYKAIAQALGCRENTARSHVLRARLKLSRRLGHLRPSSSKEVS